MDSHLTDQDVATITGDSCGWFKIMVVCNGNGSVSVSLVVNVHLGQDHVITEEVAQGESLLIAIEKVIRKAIEIMPLKRA
jgi:hypothetical protein